MGSVVVECPNTGKPVPVGIDTDPLTFQKIKALSSTGRFNCPACGMEHMWRTADAQLIDEPPRRKAAPGD